MHQWESIDMPCTQVAPAESPRLWWQHAARAVLRERRLLTAAGATCYSQARAGKRRSHQRMYSRCNGRLSWCSSNILHAVRHPIRPPCRRLACTAHAGRTNGDILICHCRPTRLAWLVFRSGPPPGAQLAAVEGGLSVHEVALCRWRVWARHIAGWVSCKPGRRLQQCFGFVS